MIDTTRITTVDSPYTIKTLDHVIRADTHNGQIIIQIPDKIHPRLRICNVGNCGNTVIINSKIEKIDLADNETINW